MDSFDEIRKIFSGIFSPSEVFPHRANPSGIPHFGQIFPDHQPFDEGEGTERFGNLPPGALRSYVLKDPSFRANDDEPDEFNSGVRKRKFDSKPRSSPTDHYFDGRFFDKDNSALNPAFRDIDLDTEEDFSNRQWSHKETSFPLFGFDKFFDRFDRLFDEQFTNPSLFERFFEDGRGQGRGGGDDRGIISPPNSADIRSFGKSTKLSVKRHADGTIEERREEYDSLSGQEPRVTITRRDQAGNIIYQSTGDEDPGVAGPVWRRPPNNQLPSISPPGFGDSIVKSSVGAETEGKESWTSWITRKFFR